MDTAELVRAGTGVGRNIDGSTKASGSSNVARAMAFSLRLMRALLDDS